VTGIRLLIVADDLTGALDCACEAAALGIGAAVFPQIGALRVAGALPPVVAVSTGTRDGDRAGAIAALRQLCALLPRLAPERVMKKVDSRLKGHPGAETAVLARALGATGLLLAPAIPDMGRVQRGGLLSGAGIDGQIDIAAAFAGCDSTIPDIAAAADFAPSLAGGALAGATLPVGARGLAGALIRSVWPGAEPHRAPPPIGPALLVVGSRDPVTLAQVARLRGRRGVTWCHAPNGEPARMVATHAPLTVLQLVPGPGPVSPGTAAASLARAAAGVLRSGPVRTVIATGGETAQALMAALGADRIAVTGMPLPGIALGLVTLAGRMPLHLVTKSGGFGQDETLVDLTAPLLVTATADGTPT